jgi:hypothetical protein
VAAACGASTPGHSGGGSASLCVPSRGCSVHRWLTDQLICLMTSHALCCDDRVRRGGSADTRQRLLFCIKMLSPECTLLLDP